MPVKLKKIAYISRKTQPRNPGLRKRSVNFNRLEKENLSLFRLFHEIHAFIVIIVYF